MDDITQTIENSYEASRADRRYRMAYVLIGLISFFAFTFLVAPVDKELYKQVLLVLVVFAGGFGAGYSVRYWRGSLRSS